MALKRYLLIGLGNPGAKYEATRHNIGFSWLDSVLANWLPEHKFTERFQSHWLSFERDGQEVHILKPQTYMNLSGQALQAWRSKYQGDHEFCVFSDDLDLPLGRLRLRPSGGDGGHRGLRSIIECLGHENFARLRIGVGREAGKDASDLVLDKFRPEEQDVLKKTLDAAPHLTDELIGQDLPKAMNVINAFRGVEE